MKKLLIAAALLLAFACSAEQARANGWGSWHGGYYHTAWGMPVSLVVPPTARYQGNYTWGVPSTYTTRIGYQYNRGMPVDGAGNGWGLSPTPYWPTNTGQFGVYYIRGPWR